MHYTKTVNKNYISPWVEINFSKGNGGLSWVRVDDTNYARFKKLPGPQCYN